MDYVEAFFLSSSKATVQMRNSKEATGTPVPVSVKAGMLFSWQTVAKVYELLFFGLEEEVSVEEAKGYTRVAVLLIVSIVLGGIVEGGAA